MQWMVIVLFKYRMNGDSENSKETLIRSLNSQKERESTNTKTH